MADADPQVSLPLSFAHEGEHPQVTMPFTVLIHSRALKGESLSLTKAVATGLLPRSGESNTEEVTLRFDLEGFALNLHLHARIETAAATEDGLIELHFTDPTGPHLAPLRYILNSYIAGDIATVGGVLGYTGPVKVATRKGPERLGFGARIARVLSKLVTAGLTVGLIYVAWTMVHDRVLYAYEPLPVTLTQDGQVIRATTAGQISYVGETAQTGDVLYSVLANSGDIISIAMPCDCVIEPAEGFAKGATVLAGEPLVRLVSPGDGLNAQTELSYPGVSRMMADDGAQLVFADGTVTPVTLSVLPDAPKSDTGLAVDVALPEGLEATVGQTAQLRFERRILPEPLRRLLAPYLPDAPFAGLTSWLRGLGGSNSVSN